MHWRPVILAFALTLPALANEGTNRYAQEIQPVLKARCYACHGALKQKGGLRVDTVHSLLAGAKAGPVLTAGKPAESSLLQRLLTKDLDERMPPEGEPLKPEEIAAIQAWIAAGAPAPANDTAEDDPRAHWAFQKIERPAVPTIAGEMANPIDAFLAAKHAEKHLHPQPAAERGILIRRVYLDLIGLPPTAEELQSDVPYERLVDQLLENPHHGERWGRHWMDVWRYSDWYGLGAQIRNSQKHMWHWRDWIIGSLNADKGYDRMIQEMLAGDELAPTDPKALSATGYLARNYYLFNRTTWLDDTVEHTAKAFLGLTLNCAKCHDHKYDPLEQTDYYRFRAIFEPYQVRLDPVPGVSDFEKDGLPRVFDEDMAEPTYLHVRGDPKHPDKTAPIPPGVPVLFASFQPEIEPVKLPASAYRPAVREEWRALLISQAGNAAAALKARLAADDALLAKSPDAAALVMKAVKAERELAVAKAEEALQAAKTTKDEAKIKTATTAMENARKILAADASKAKHTPVPGAKKALESPADKESDYGIHYPETSSGRRLALARWMTSRENPLTARVAVNHVWLRHFGEPLVPTVFDFGRQAPKPELLALLDYLACELIDSGWRLKHLHRLMVTSQAYQRASSPIGADAATVAADPNNHLYWRMNSRRMESQIVRDSLLQLAGKLDPALGGPAISPKTASARRSLYFTHSPDEPNQFLGMFDDADMLACYRRSESIVPQQALALSNSRLSLDMAEAIAAQWPAATERDAFIAGVFGQLLARKPTDAELSECRVYWDEMHALLHASKVANAENRLRSRFVHALLNHNDFVTIR